MNPWDIPMYTVAAVARLVRLHPDRVRRWLHGYDYFYLAGSEGETRYSRKEPIVRRSEAAASQHASF